MNTHWEQEQPQAMMVNPLADAGWQKLCHHPRWNYRRDDPDATAIPPSPEEGEGGENSPLFFGQVNPTDGSWNIACTAATEGPSPPLVATPAEASSRHRGTRAPAWVWATLPTCTSKARQVDESLPAYQRRLVCAVLGRFVVVPGSGTTTTTLATSGGRPVPGQRYRWRYWDNAGNVYEDSGESDLGGLLFHGEFGGSETDVAMASTTGENATTTSSTTGALPGDFADGVMPWMRHEMAGGSTNTSADMGEFLLQCYFGKGCDQTTQVGRFWECLWAWKYQGSTGHGDWDDCLDLLAHTAGLPVEACHRQSPADALQENCEWRLQEFDLDALAAEKSWEKIPVPQNTLASYQRDGVRLTFHLATGKVESTWDVPMQGIFRRHRWVQDSVDAAILLDGLLSRGGHHYPGDRVPPRSNEKRKADPLGRVCAQCWETKALEDFSKNQLRQGPTACCLDCLSLSD